MLNELHADISAWKAANLKGYDFMTTMKLLFRESHYEYPLNNALAVRSTDSASFQFRGLDINSASTHLLVYNTRIDGTNSTYQVADATSGGSTMITDWTNEPVINNRSIEVTFFVYKYL